MKFVMNVVVCCAFASSAAMAQDSVRFGSTWIGGGDTVMEVQATADWYKAVFGMRETNRFGSGIGRSLGVRMNFGLTAEAARTAPGVAMGVTTSFVGPPGVRNDEFARVAFTVADLDSIKRRALENGGSVKSGPTSKGGESTLLLRDPRGNVVEVVAPRTAPATPVEFRTLRLPAVDVEKTVAFYERVFAMREVSRSGSKSTLEVLLDVPAGNAMGSVSHPLLAIAAVATMPQPTMTSSASQITYSWSGVDELTMMLKRAAGYGPTFLRSPFFAKGDQLTYVRLTDPTGNIVEFAGKCRPNDGQDDAVIAGICRGE